MKSGLCSCNLVVSKLSGHAERFVSYASHTEGTDTALLGIMCTGQLCPHSGFSLSVLPLASCRVALILQFCIKLVQEAQCFSCKGFLKWFSEWIPC